ncbi:hypothetical protein [Streptomyces fumanus]|uniref:Uncharacterized protein n=1 Tax=Streptomyces fumanus TaxID=67302 RepID=A0A919EA41_9ACTN|nr:hypothetical protein [Streptomyces fumanus]GHF29248.1 hypothetical protein GCM10018772_63460 [Streptomyces fumanus]
MDIARHIALIDELCSRPLPAGHGPSDDGGEGERHLVVLRTSHGVRGGDPAERAAVVDQYEKERDAVDALLAERWGESEIWNLGTVLLRAERAEEIPEPWAELSARARVAYLRDVTGTGRWVALAVADRDPADEVQLLAAVTRTAPP